MKNKTKVKLYWYCLSMCLLLVPFGQFGLIFFGLSLIHLIGLIIIVKTGVRTWE